MIIAHQPGSEPLTIPEQIPNPAFQPAPLRPERTPVPQEPVKVPEKAPAGVGYFCRPVEFAPEDSRSSGVAALAAGTSRTRAATP
jgi:hypothetical protein